MSKKYRNRYVFLNYEELKSVKFKQLEKNSDRIFIVVSESVKEIPLRLAKKLQPLGDRILWQSVYAEDKNDLNNHISFLMGKMHESENPLFEFVLISNDEKLDSLVGFINAEGRTCIRIKYKVKKADKVSMEEADFDKVPEPDLVTFENNDRELDRDIIDEAAKDTLNRLVTSGNRPAEVSTLKSYILLHNKENNIHGYLDEVIRQLETYDEIMIEEGEVSYNF